MLRRFILIALLGAGVMAPVPAGAGGEGRIDVVVVRGNLDARLTAFAVGSIERSDASLVVLQLDVPTVLDDSVWDLIETVADPPLPVAVWVGPTPASALGGAAVALAAAPIGGAAPGSVVGLASPVRTGGPDDLDAVLSAAAGLPEAAVTGLVEVGVGGVPGIVDLVEPSIGQFVVSLHGREVEVGGRVVVLDTAVSVTEDGVETLKPSLPVRFVEPGLLDRILQTSTQPETVFFFLVMGLALAVFEFFAAGPGIAAAVAAALLLLAGHGLVALPVWWPAIVAVLAGLVLYVVEFQRNDLGWKSVLGTFLLAFGGLRLVEPSPQLSATWWIVILVVLGAAVFFGVALTTVARARFATQTIGREHLVGRRGVARGPVVADGYVEVGGATWKASSTRAAGIEDGDPVVVVAVNGIVLSVDPVGESSDDAAAR